jgi:hypothetical protein
VGPRLVPGTGRGEISLHGDDGLQFRRFADQKKIPCRVVREMICSVDNVSI